MCKTFLFILGFIVVVTNSQSISCDCRSSFSGDTSVTLITKNIPQDKSYWVGIYKVRQPSFSQCTFQVEASAENLYREADTIVLHPSPQLDTGVQYYCLLYSDTTCIGLPVDSSSFTCSQKTPSTPPSTPPLPPTTRSNNGNAPALAAIIPSVLLAVVGCGAFTVICIIIIRRKRLNNSTTTQVNEVELHTAPQFPTAPMQTHVPLEMPNSNVIYGNPTATGLYVQPPALMPVYMGTNTQ